MASFDFIPKFWLDMDYNAIRLPKKQVDRMNTIAIAVLTIRVSTTFILS
jgi:hypothetical protein